MPRSVSIKLTTNSQKPNKKGLVSIKIRITINRVHHLRKTGVEVALADWHHGQGAIKTNSVAKYPESNNLLRAINDRVEGVSTRLLKSKISVETAFDELMGLNIIDGTVLDFVENFKADGTIKYQTINKHIANLKAVERRLKLDGNKKLVPLCLDHLNDLSIVRKINASIITTKPSLKSNTIASYQKSLNWVATRSKLTNPKPFTTERLLVKEKESDKNNPIESDQLMLGFNEIKTLRQFEALCFWLYSFCLLGLDGIDICRIEEKKIVTDSFKGDLRDFIPEAEVLGLKELAKPLHVHLKRSKTSRQGRDSGVDAIFLINLFPTLQIHRLLKNAMEHQPYAYKGKDKLRLFNFDIETPEGLKKWIEVRKGYGQAITKRIGTTTQRARHTIGHEGGKIGLSQNNIDQLLNHKIKGVAKHYLSKNQLACDIAHTHILQNYSILKVFEMLIKAFKNRTDQIKGKVVRWIPEDMLDSTNYSRDKKNTPLYIHQTLKLGYLTSFTREEEIRYQTLLKDANKGSIDFDPESGEIVRQEPDESKYPKELKDLIQKRTSKYFEPEYKVTKNGVLVKTRNQVEPRSMEWIDPTTDSKPASKVVRLKSS